jgi:hypothetical protein
MLKTQTLYAVKRDGKYLVKRAGKTAEDWSEWVEDALPIRELRWAHNIASKIKGSAIVELTIIERVMR